MPTMSTISPADVGTYDEESHQWNPPAPPAPEPAAPAPKTKE